MSHIFTVKKLNWSDEARAAAAEARHGGGKGASESGHSSVSTWGKPLAHKEALGSIGKINGISASGPVEVSAWNKSAGSAGGFVSTGNFKRGGNEYTVQIQDQGGSMDMTPGKRSRVIVQRVDGPSFAGDWSGSAMKTYRGSSGFKNEVPSLMDKADKEMSKK